MSWSPLLRVVEIARRPRRADAGASLASENHRRHPAMAGIDVPPVHGRHCICQRCERESRAGG